MRTAVFSIVCILLLYGELHRTYGQGQCQCKELHECLEDYDEVVLKAAATCRSQCQPWLHPKYAKAAIECFEEKEEAIVEAKRALRECLEEQVGAPYVHYGPGNAAQFRCHAGESESEEEGEEEEHGKPGEKGEGKGGKGGGEGAKGKHAAGGGGHARQKRALLTYGPPRVMSLPPYINTFMSCYSWCQTEARHRHIWYVMGRDGVNGYPGCASKLNCILLPPANVTATATAASDCSSQVGTEVQENYQTFCQCLKKAIRTDGQYVKCDIYGSSGSEEEEGESEEHGGNATRGAGVFRRHGRAVQYNIPTFL